MPNVNASFKQFIKDVTPADHYYKVTFPARLKGVKKDMSAAFPAGGDISFVSAKYIGSASKKTMISPVEDLDILAEFHLAILTSWSYASDSTAFITRIKKSYDGFHTQVVGTRGQAIRVFYKNGGHVDVVPAIRIDYATYKIPDGKGGWIQTSPERANEWFFDRQRDLNYRLKDMVKLIKRWNLRHSSRLKSFHIETMVATMFTDLQYYQDLNVIDFFGAASRFLDVNDPGMQSGNLSDYLTYAARNDVVQAFDTAHAKAIEARRLEVDGDLDGAIAKWKWIFGQDFPE